MADKHQTCIDMLDCIENGRAVLTAGREIIPNLKHTIHDMPQARHLGFGFFKCEVDGIECQFDAGGAMNRIEMPDNEYWGAWSPLSVDDPRAFEVLGIDLDEQRKAVVEWMTTE